MSFWRNLLAASTPLLFAIAAFGSDAGCPPLYRELSAPERTAAEVMDYLRNPESPAQWDRNSALYKRQNRYKGHSEFKRALQQDMEIYRTYLRMSGTSAQKAALEVLDYLRENSYVIDDIRVKNRALSTRYFNHRSSPEFDEIIQFDPMAVRTLGGQNIEVIDFRSQLVANELIGLAERDPSLSTLKTSALGRRVRDHEDSSTFKETLKSRPAAYRAYLYYKSSPARKTALDLIQYIQLRGNLREIARWDSILLERILRDRMNQEFLDHLRQEPKVRMIFEKWVEEVWARQ